MWREARAQCGAKNSTFILAEFLYLSTGGLNHGILLGLLF